MDKIIKEDYVSYKIAELLKEKGFNEPCRAYYKMGGLKEDMTVPRDWSHSVYIDHTSAPTLQMTMKWLREVHNIFIQIELYSKNGDYCFEVFKNTHRIIVEKGEVYNTYEEACEESLKYCLINLIK